MLTPISFLSRSDVPEGDQGTNEVQVGGLNTSDSRFAVYKNYKGCLSSKCVCLLQDGVQACRLIFCDSQTLAHKISCTV